MTSVRKLLKKMIYTIKKGIWFLQIQKNNKDPERFSLFYRSIIKHKKLGFCIVCLMKPVYYLKIKPKI